jgi:hypothetical protein
MSLQYRIGGLEINPEKFLFTGPIPHKADHRFVVAVSGDVAEIYVAAFDRHAKVAEHFGLGEPDMTNFGRFKARDGVQIVGGGSCYLYGNRDFVIASRSGDFDGISKYAAQLFGDLIAEELKSHGMDVRNVVANPYEKMNPFWKE